MSEQTNIVPFGKYKGRLIEELLVDDPSYLEWLAGQDWFRAKYVTLHQVIINRGAEPEETPEHNALQVQFLDDEFCLSVHAQLALDYETKARDKFNDARAANLQLVLAKIEAQNEAPSKADEKLASELQRIAQYESHQSHHPNFATNQRADAREQRERQRGAHIKRLAQLNHLRELLSPPITTVNFQFEREFEVDGVDVVLEISADILWSFGVDRDVTGAPRDSFWSRYDWQEWQDRVSCRAKHKIEIKPTVGDDYPAVLRQMKANGSTVLFLEQYTGKGATREQFIKTFATASIRVVFAEDVEPHACLPNATTAAALAEVDAGGGKVYRGSGADVIRAIHNKR